MADGDDGGVLVMMHVIVAAEGLGEARSREMVSSVMRRLWQREQRVQVAGASYDGACCTEAGQVPGE